MRRPMHYSRPSAAAFVCWVHYFPPKTRHWSITHLGGVCSLDRQHVSTWSYNLYSTETHCVVHSSLPSYHCTVGTVRGCRARRRYLWTGKPLGCIDSSAVRTPPSCGRSSELLLAVENSTGTVCRGTQAVVNNILASTVNKLNIYQFTLIKRETQPRGSNQAPTGVGPQRHVLP